MQKNYTWKPNKQEDILRKSTKPFLKDEFLNKLDEKEWNRRMKTWEKKREQLELGLMFSQGVRNEQKQQPRVSYGTPTNQSKNERMETSNTTSPRESAIEEVNNFVPPNEYIQNDFQDRYTQHTDGEENGKVIKKEDEVRSEICANEVEIGLITKEHVSDYDEGSRGSDSVEAINNLRNTSLQCTVEKHPEIIGKSSSKGGLFLSPIQSVSENNCYSDEATKSHNHLESSNLKEPKVGIDMVKPEEPHLKQEDDSPMKEKFEEKDFTENKVLVSLWACDQSVSDERHRKEHLVDSLSTELPLSVSGNRKMSVEGLPLSVSGNRKMSVEGLASEPEISGKIRRDYQKSDERLEVLGERKDKSSTSGCACIKKNSDLTIILDKLFTVTKALNDQHLSRRFRKNHSKPFVCDDANDRSTLNAIVCYPLGSPVVEIESLSAIPVLSESDSVHRRVTGPVVYESVASSPAEFYEKARETTNRYLKSVKDGGQKSATRIEWYEGEYVPMSSEEMETHHEVICDSCISTESHKEAVVDRRKCKVRKDGHSGCPMSRIGYDMRNYEIKRYEVRRDVSNCHSYNIKR